MPAAEFRQILETCDIAGARRAWAKIAPGAPQPKTDQETLVAIHYARTLAISLALRHRAYSHRWMLDHDLPSGLPDHLKPAAERIYPRVVEGVGIAIKPLSPLRVDAAIAMREAMELAVLDAYADGRTDPEFVKARMREARDRTLRLG